MSDRNVRLKIEAVSDLPTVADQLAELIRLNKSFEEATRQAALSARTGSIQQVDALQAVTAALEKQRTTQKKANDEAAASNKELNDSLDKLTSNAKTLGGMIAAAFAISEIKQFGLDVIEAKTQIDSIKISLDTMLGSKRESAELYAQIVELAKKTPYTLQEVSDQAVKLKAYNIATADLIPTITALGNIAAGVGKEKLPQLTLAYGQVANAGTLMLTELRQFNEAGVPLIQMIADAYCKTRGEVQKMADGHEISFAMVRKALMDASAEGGRFAGLMEKLSTTVGGQVSNLSDAFQVAKGRIGDFFEDGIQRGTVFLKELITSLTGSDAAIKRTLLSVASAATAFLTLNSATKLAASLQAAWTVATAGAQLAAGTYNIALIAMKGTTEGLTEAQLASATAAKTTWATLSANPLGAIITVIGLATSAYLAFQAANEEVTDSVSQQEGELRKEQATLEGLVNKAIQATEGTNERRRAIQTLIANYPEYFKGLDVEKTSNTDLVRILGNVNRGYEQRIDLARQAYQAEKLSAEQFKLLQEEDDIFAKMNPAIDTKFGGNLQAAFDAFTSGKMKYDEIFTNVKAGYFGDKLISQEDVNRVTYRLKEIQGLMADNEVKVNQIKELGKAADLQTEEARHVTVMNQLKAAHKSTQAEEDLHAANISKIKQVAQKEDEASQAGHEEKTKQMTILSGNERAALLKEQDAKTLAEKLKALDAEEKAEMDAVTKITVSKNISNAQIIALEKRASDEVLDIRAKFNEKRDRLIEEDRRNFEDALDADISGMQKLIDKTKEEQNAYMNRASKFGEFDQERIRSYKDIAKEAEEAEKKIQDTADIRKKAAEEAKEALVGQRQAVGNLFISLGSLMGQKNEMAGLLSGVLNTTLGNMDLISGKSKEVASNALTNAEGYYNIAKVRYADAGKEGELAIAEAGKRVEVAKDGVNKVDAASMSMALGLASMFISVAQVIGATFDKIHTQVYQAISNALGESLKSYNEFYDSLERLQRESLDLSLTAYAGNFREQKRLLDEFYDGQREQAKNRDFMNDMLASGKEYADAILAAGRDTVWNHKNYVEQMAQAEIAINRDKYARQQQMIINQLEIEKEHLKEVLDRTLDALDQELQAYTDTKNAEIDKAKETADNAIAENKRALDEKVAGLQTQIQANKDNYDQNVQLARDSYDKQLTALRDAQSAERTAIQETFDLKKSLLEQAASDEIEAITIVDRLRNEAVERYGISEADKLIKTRDRILATLTDEKEKADVITFYDGKLKDLHDTVENAKLDKSLGVQLATKQLNKELKDDTVLLKGEETTALKNLDDSYQIKFKSLADERDTKLTTLKDDYLARETKLKADIKTLETNSKSEINKIQTDLKDEINKLKDQITQKEDETTQAKKQLNFEYKQAVLPDL